MAVHGGLVDPRRTEHPVGLPVEPAEIMPAGAEGPGDAVARGIAVVVGVGRGDQGDAELAGGLYAGNAE